MTYSAPELTLVGGAKNLVLGGTRIIADPDNWVAQSSDLAESW